MNEKFNYSPKNLVMIVCFLVSLAIFITGCVSTTTVTPVPVKEYQLFNSTFGKYSANLTIEKMPETILVYKTEKSDYTCEWGEKLTQRLGMPGECYKTNYGFYINESLYGGRRINVESNIGVIYFSDQDRWTKNPEKDKPQNLPSDEQIAGNVSEFLKSNNLFIYDARFAGTSHSQKINTNELNVNEVVQQITHVIYFRELNSRRVQNSIITIAEGEDYDIVDMFINWRNYTPYKDAPLRSVESAFQEFSTRELWCTKISGSPDTVTVTNVTLVYYSQVPAAAGDEKYLQPVYVFESTAKQGNRTSSCSTEYIPATVERFQETD